MEIGLSSLLALPLALQLASAPVDDERAERDHQPRFAELASGVFRGEHRQYPWPVRVLSIGHTIASYQNYGGSPYFHHGIDIRADAHSDVVASAGGRVVNIENYMTGPAYWEVAILDDEGFLWQYHHVLKESIPQNIWDAYQTGGRIAQGTKIGQVYPWQHSAFGEVFHHIHLNILGADKTYLNPFAFLEPLADHQAPRVESITKAPKGSGYTLLVEVSDLILHQKFTVPPYRIEYSINGQSPALFWQFDHLPGKASKTEHIERFYVPGKTCGNYQCRRHVVDLSFAIPGAAKPSFPTHSGTHRVQVHLSDFAGNETTGEFTWSLP